MGKIIVISECGLNHNGNFNRAKKQIRLSKEAGADCVKFQFYDPEKLLGKDSPYLQYATSAMFSKDRLEELKAYADKIKIEFMCSVFDKADIPWVDNLVKRHKVASRMNKDEDFIMALHATRKPVIISGVDLYCVTNYPAKLSDFKTLDDYNGFSNHCPSIAPALRYASEMLKKGGGVIEAHTTTSKSLPGCDQSSSWTYAQLETFVSIVRDMEKMTW